MFFFIKDVIIQISVKDKHLSTVSEKIKDIKTTLGFKEDDSNFGLSGSLLSAAMSLFQKKEFKDVVICIDDFERKSSKLDIKDILGPKIIFVGAISSYKINFDLLSQLATRNIHWNFI